MVISATKLVACYGKTRALSDFSFELHNREILAVLGPNGSGKTTLFRLLLGLIQPSEGQLQVLGRRPGEVSGLARIGATIENPSLYGHLSARENLEITSHLKGLSPSGRCLELLHMVELEYVEKALVSTFSLGMRQRLALAQALVGEPELLILDEPTNGLDPAGIRWFREWVVGAPAALGVSVIISSHILHEVAQVADRVILLKEGQLRFCGSLDELKEPAEACVRVRTRDLEASWGLLAQRGLTVRLVHGELRLDIGGDQASEVVRILVQGGQDLLHLSFDETSLEERYLSLMEAE